jgi:hypothetical protein
VKPLPQMLRRQRAVEATEARFGGKSINWRGGPTCVHMARFHIRKMGRRVPAMPTIRSMAGAKRALTARGWANVCEMLDGIGLERIAPAFLRLGDLVVIGSEDGLGSIFISTGEAMFIGWPDEVAELARVEVVNPDGLLGAWRV